MATFLSKAKESAALTGSLSEADIVVCCGRGLGDDDGFLLAVEFAECIGAQIAGTRSALDAHWLSHDRELGLSGARVAPRLYIGCGVSGTNFHTIGMKNSGCIIAINTDPTARIFSITNIPVHKKVKDVLSELISEIHARDPFADSDDAINYLTDYFTEKQFA